jgi:2,5-diamino-6-(ribosylamino)-4(3H)-pyrimidinone 5'-phosphate reductase
MGSTYALAVSGATAPRKHYGGPALSMPQMRPFVTVNCAMTADGKIAGKERRQISISSPEDRERVRKLKAEHDAILVGIDTVLADDPHLTVKGAGYTENPVRVVLDSMGRTPEEARVVDGKARTIVATNDVCLTTWPRAEAIRCGRRRVDLERLLPQLYDRGIRTLLVEGGGEVIWSFFKAGFVDRYLVYVGGMVAGGRNAPSPADGDGFVDHEIVALRLMEMKQMGEGVLLSYEVVH